jgi:DnaJ-class molecular chaperone
VDDSASWSEIQTAYKNKAKQYHPDKLSHLGEEFSNLANEKFLEIQQAYVTLRSIYNR